MTALLEVTRSSQALLQAVQDDSGNIPDFTISFLDARTCDYDVAGENTAAYLGVLQSELYNTEARVTLYFAANEAFGGETYTFPAEPMSTCT